MWLYFEIQSTLKMKKIITTIGIAAKIWIVSSLLLGAGAFIISCIFNIGGVILFSFILPIPAAIGSLPVLLLLWILLPKIEQLSASRQQKILNLVVICFACSFIYGIIGGMIITSLSDSSDWLNFFVERLLIVTGSLFTCALLSLLLLRRQLHAYFSSPNVTSSINQFNNMETTQPVEASLRNNETNTSNKIMIKGIITGALILVLMIPTLFITNLVSEREKRQQEVAKEVSGKWATAQTLTGPYLYVPYKTYYKDKENKMQEEYNHLWILPNNLNVSGKINHEMRPRSIYKVLLYKTSLQAKGDFLLKLPSNIDKAAIQWTDARICYGISDFKGIEERLAIKLDGNEYELSPGLPSNDIDTMGLSVPVNLTISDVGKNIPFDGQLKIKGSGQLHFVPLSGNSSFALTSTWSSPSFDGNNLPTERKIGDNGFSAIWSFNKANLPFGTVLKDFKFDLSTLAFGVTMLEPADQYAKTSRCVKYAILFIGLTFSLFFIVELMQKKPVHPVQYVLIGLALVIFYTLLLSISEFILFDYAYLIAALGTILLITLYARAHFNSWKSAAIFGGVLSVLYGFIFILIRLEDTALLVGSIGLFIVLALVMYASRKVNWYGTTVSKS